MGMSKSKVVRYILLGAGALDILMPAASTVRHLTATCGLVLLSQVLTHTTCFTIVAMSTRPALISVSSGFQSAVLPDIFHYNQKEKSEFNLMIIIKN